VPSVCPASGETGGPRGHGVGRDGMTNPRRIKAIAGNSASCLGFSIALLTGSIPAASNRGCPPPRVEPTPNEEARIVLGDQIDSCRTRTTSEKQLCYRRGVLGFALWTTKRATSSRRIDERPTLLY
jgi:hypothetical protein